MMMGRRVEHVGKQVPPNRKKTGRRAHPGRILARDVRRMFWPATGSKCFRSVSGKIFTMIRTKAKLAPFMLSLPKHERDESSVSPPFDRAQDRLRPFDRLMVHGECLCSKPTIHHVFAP
jgi:hypothetical protein